MISRAGEQVYLSSLIEGASAGDEGCFLRDHHFTRCTIYGPAMVFLFDDVRVVDATFGRGKVDTLILVDERPVRLGVIGISGSTFDTCDFVGIAFTCSPDAYGDFRAALGEWIT